MEAVQGAVDRGIKQLSASQGPTQNAAPGDQYAQGYAMPARTPEEVMQQSPGIMDRPADIPRPTPQQVQQQLHVPNNDMFAQLSRAQDPAQQQLGQPLPNQPMPQPPQQVQATPSGLILPDGPPPQQVQGASDEGAGSGNGADSVSWLL